MRKPTGSAARRLDHRRAGRRKFALERIPSVQGLPHHIGCIRERAALDEKALALGAWGFDGLVGTIIQRARCRSFFLMYRNVHHDNEKGWLRTVVRPAVRGYASVLCEYITRILGDSKFPKADWPVYGPQRLLHRINTAAHPNPDGYTMVLAPGGRPWRR